MVDEKINLDDLYISETNEWEEEQNVSSAVEEILEENKSKENDKEYISNYNKENKLTSEDIKSEKILENPDIIEQSLMKNQNINNDEEENMKNKSDEQNKNQISIYDNKNHIKFPEEFDKNPTPFKFIDFMENKYNKYILDETRDKYFYLEKYQKDGKFNDVKCWKFTKKNSIMDHILENSSNSYISKKKIKTKIACLVAYDDSIYIGDSNGVIKIFSLKSEIEIGILNEKSENLINISKNNDEKKNVSVTSMDILPDRNVLACGYYNGLVEIWDLKEKYLKKKLLPSLSKHMSEILALKFLNGNTKALELISSDCSGLVNITTLTEGIFKFKKNTELNANINILINYEQPIFVLEILKFTEEEKKMAFLKNNIDIIGFACYDYVYIYQIHPQLMELFKFQRPEYFKDYYIPNISFGRGYIPRSKNIIDINKDQNQKLNEKAAEQCIDVKNINRLVAISWDNFINIYAIKFDEENGIEAIAIVGNYINSCRINRMFFAGDSLIFIYDEEGIFKLLNTGMMSPGEIILKKIGKKKVIPLYDEEKEKRAYVQKPKRIIDNVLKENYIPLLIKNSDNDTKETYYNSIYTNNKNIYILGEKYLEYGEIYSFEECVNNLMNDSERINALIFGLKVYEGEYISFSGVPIDGKKRKEIIGEKMKKIIKKYVNDIFSISKGQINEANYNEMLTQCVYLSIEFCFKIQSADFLFKNILPIYLSKNYDKFFYESLEPFIINGDLENQILEEKILEKIVLLFTQKKKYQELGQIIKNLYLSVADSESVGNRTTKYETIFTGLITYCSGEKNKDFMFPAREIYSFLQSAKQIPNELYLKIKNENGKKRYYYDYENVVNNTDIDELILSYQYLGSMLLWYIELCREGYKFPSGKLIEEVKHNSLIQQLFLWLINDEVLQRLIEFDSYSLFSIFKKFFMNNYKVIKKIEYSDLFKLIKIGDKELQEANIQKYIEIIYRKAIRIDKGANNIYVDDDLYDFICTIATKNEILCKSDSKNNFLLDALNHVIKYKENYEVMENREQVIIDKRGENYNKYAEEKDKYDRYCMHLNRYKEQNFISNLSNVIMAAVDNNLKFFSKEDLQELLKETDKTELKTVKIYLAKSLGDFAKCLDVYLNEYNKQERFIHLKEFINNQFEKLKTNKNEFNTFKNDVLSRATQIASLSIYNIIELTEKWFEGNYNLILFKITDKSIKLKYLEEILYKYKEDEMGQNDEVIKEYVEILKLHIDLLCELKYYDKILPNLKRRYFYPVDFCLKKCSENNIYDAWIYLERKDGNISEALKLVNILTKKEFSKLKKFWNDNYEQIIKLENERKELLKKKINDKNEKKDDEDGNDSDSNSYLDENEYINECEEENQKKKNLENDLLYKKIKYSQQQNSILRMGIEICEDASETLPKKEAQENWSSLIKLYYLLINEIKDDLIKNELNIKVGEKIIKKLENNIDEVIEKMNLYFNLNSVLDLLSEIQGKSFGTKEFKSHLRKLIFSGMSFNYILKAADSIVKNTVLESSNSYQELLKQGKKYNFEKCDFCNKIFKENTKNLTFFNCGHKYHYDCCIFVNNEISCRICKEREIIDEDINFSGKDEIIEAVEKVKEKDKGRINRINSIYHSSSSMASKIKSSKGRNKLLKSLNEVNKKYFETSKIFDI